MLRVMVRVSAIAAVAVWLGACSSMPNPFAKNDKPAAEPAAAEQTTSAQAGEATQAMAADLPVEKVAIETDGRPTIVAVKAEPAPAAEAAVAKPLPQDDVSLGKKYYRARDYGLAEQHFRAAAESQPRNAEAWLGLAASYDELRRFDLADRAYAQAIRIAGEQVAIINNQGYSYILRGDYRRARERLMLANVKAPDNPYVQANLKLLGERSGWPVAGQ